MKPGKNQNVSLVLSVLFCGILNAGLWAQIPCTEITEQAGIEHHYLAITYMGGGAAFFDFDNDGDEDLWIAGGLNQDALYENDGTGNFTEIGTAAGLEATNGHVNSGVITGDLDNDGFKDVVLTGHIGFPPQLFKNNGDGTFTEISASAGLADFAAQCHSAAMGDVNLDGFLDIYIATYIENIVNIYDANNEVIGFDHDCLDNLLFINNGDWTFTEQSENYGLKDGGCALAATFTDYDLDADPDLLIANDFGEWIIPNALYQNENPTEEFSDVSQNSGMNIGVYGMGIAVGDYDKDLDLDYYITNLGRNVLLENDGNASFTDMTSQTGVEDTNMDSLLAIGWGTAFMDVDNDTDLDLFVCNGHVPAADFIKNNKANRNRLFINDGNPNGTGYEFYETAFESGMDHTGRGRGFAYADIDNDGDLDFLVINNNKHTTADTIENTLLYRNDLDNNYNWLKVKLEGVSNNRDGFGATIKIVLDGQSWIHDYNGGYGPHAAQHSAIAHFGLGNAPSVDSLVVTWPGGVQHTFVDLVVNEMICITENGVITNVESPELQQPAIRLSATPNPFKNQTRIEFHLAAAEDVAFEIYNALGQHVKSFDRKWYPAGTHSFDWTTDLISTWSFIKLKTEKQTKILKLIHIK